MQIYIILIFFVKTSAKVLINYGHVIFICIFDRLVTRHFGYYIFVTNDTVAVDDLAGLEPVYHDEFPTSEISQQNTIVFPNDIFGRQVYVYVNVSSPSKSHYAVIEPCEVEIYGELFLFPKIKEPLINIGN